MVGRWICDFDRQVISQHLSNSYLEGAVILAGVIQATKRQYSHVVLQSSLGSLQDIHNLENEPRTQVSGNCDFKIGSAECH
jgi:hypothetical protein